MSVEDQPGYARWVAANNALTEARTRLEQAPEHERAAAQLAYYQAQEAYDAAVDALGYDGDEPRT